jgi:hypothetical protein
MKKVFLIFLGLFFIFQLYAENDGGSRIELGAYCSIIGFKQVITYNAPQQVYDAYGSLWYEYSASGIAKHPFGIHFAFLGDFKGDSYFGFYSGIGGTVKKQYVISYPDQDEYDEQYSIKIKTNLGIKYVYKKSESVFGGGFSVGAFMSPDLSNGSWGAGAEALGSLYIQNVFIDLGAEFDIDSFTEASSNNDETYSYRPVSCIIKLGYSFEL